MGYRIRESTTKGMDNGDLAWAVIEPLWDAVDFSRGAKQVAATLSEATQGQKLLFAVDWCQKEVRNGGFEQYFLNNAGMLWREALGGFRAIGAIGYATLLENALSVFPGAEAHASKTERAKFLRSVPKAERNALFDPLETEFYKLLRNEVTDLEKYRAAYIQAHPSEFFDV